MSESDKDSRRCQGLLNYWANCERIGVKCGSGAIWRVGEHSKISWAVDPPILPFNIQFGWVTRDSLSDDSVAQVEAPSRASTAARRPCYAWPSPPRCTRHRTQHEVYKSKLKASNRRHRNARVNTDSVVFKSELVVKLEQCLWSQMSAGNQFTSTCFHLSRFYGLK